MRSTTLASAPWAGVSRGAGKAPGQSRLPANPSDAAASTSAGNGTSKKKIATNPAAAMAFCARPTSARLPMRMTASTTTASTAAFSPKNRAPTAGRVRYVAYSALSPSMARKPGSTNNRPATRPPGVRCMSQPMYVASCCASGPGSSMQ